MQHFLLLFIPGVIGGMINAIAGGGGIVMYPALLATGLSPVIANATVSFAVLPGAVSAVVGYRTQFAKVAKHFLWLVLPCMVGAFYGARILSTIHPETFATLSPWLVLSAVLLLGLQARINRLIITEKHIIKTTSRIAIPLLYLIVFGLAIYGGFFGAGFGLMMLVVLGFSSLKSTHQTSAIKNLCGIGIACVAASYFAVHGLLDIPSGAIMATGTVVGGYSGAKLSQKISSHLVHDLTVVIGLIIALLLLVKS
jgi:uncharacterized protein